jgi:hypothetical protein
MVCTPVNRGNTVFLGKEYSIYLSKERNMGMKIVEFKQIWKLTSTCVELRVLLTIGESP